MRPEGFDALDAVHKALGGVPKSFPLEVVIHTTLERARWSIHAEVAVLEVREASGVLLRSPDWKARLLASLGCRLEIIRPPELRDALRRHAVQITQWADAGPS